MRAAICVTATLIAGLTWTGAATLTVVSGGALGVSSAEAASFYTRKRVGGRWITGHFAKGGSGTSSHGRRHAASRRSHRSRSYAGRHETPQAASRAEPTAKPAPRPSTVTTTGTLAALPPIGEPSTVSLVERDPRLSKLKDALQVRAREIAVKEPPPASPNSGGAAPSASAPQPKSVSFDFESGLKTTVFEGNVAVREPFDTAAMKTLASRPPAGTASTKAP